MGIAVIIPNLDFSGHGLGKVTLNQSIPLVSMSIAGNTTVIGKSATYKALLYPGNTSERAVTWSVISGGTYASIDASTGVLAIAGSADEATVVIKATSTDNSEIYATLELTVTYAGDTYGEDLTDNLTWTSGYIAEDYSIKSSSVSRYSNAVAVNEDDILLCRAIGFGMRIVTECDGNLSNKKYGLFAAGWQILSSSVLYNYAYHASSNGYVCFCSKQGEGVEFWKAGKIADITPTWQSGYIDTSGALQSSQVTQHSAPIPVSAGDIIVVKTAGTGFSIVSLTDQSGSSYTPILVQNGGIVENTGKFQTKNATCPQDSTPIVETTGTFYQGVSNPTNTPVTYAVYISEDSYVSVCGKTSLEVAISKYKAG